MGNPLSKVLSKPRKKKTKRIQRRKKMKEKIVRYKWEGGLEIEDCCETEEQNTISGDYWKGNKDCSKSKRHSDYIPFENLTLDHLPDAIRHPAVYEYIRARGNLVVFIRVSKKSPDREEMKDKDYGHCASGFACICDDVVDLDCLLSNCSDDNSGNNHKVFGGIVVKTNKHVIIDDLECQESRFTFFYESSDPKRDKSVVGHGYSIRDDSSKNKDYVGVKIFLHDESAMERLRQFSSEADEAWQRIPEYMQTEFEKHSVVISHPHNWPKQVSFGRLLEKELSLDENQNEDTYYENYFNDLKKLHGDEYSDEKKRELFLPGRRISRYTSMTCTGSSGSPVLTGIYWDNPFIHSSGFKRLVYEEDEGDFEIWGESYFY